MLGVVQIIREIELLKFELPCELSFIWGNRETYP
jgi:hypothetical protein